MKHLITVILLLASLMASANNSLPETDMYKVWINGVEQRVNAAGDNHHGRYGFASFDYDGPVTVRVHSTMEFRHLTLMPSARGIEYKVLDFKTFEFQLDEPEYITVLFDNDKQRALHLIPDQKLPARETGADDIIFKSGQTYDVGILDLHSNQTLVIEEDAVIRGMVRVRDAENVVITGRGAIEGSYNKSEGNEKDANQWRMIYLENAKNVRIEGITLYNSLRWTIHPFNCHDLSINDIRIINWNYGSDGIDICASQNVNVTNSFIRTNDDNIAIKALSFRPDCYYPNPKVYNTDVKGIHVDNCVMWNMPYGNNFEIGFELRCHEVSDISFTNSDIIMQDDRGSVLSIHNGDYAHVHDVRIENINIENINLCTSSKFIDMAIVYSYWSYDKCTDLWLTDEPRRYCGTWDNLLYTLPGKEEFHSSNRGRISDVHIKNINVFGNSLPFSAIEGYDADHLVENVLIEKVKVNGKRIRNAKELDLIVNNARNIRVK